MTEQTWTSATSEPPPKKKGVPAWVWVCGSGCLVLAICGMIATWFAWRAFQRATDPERVWPEVARILPVEPPYPDFKVIEIPMAWVPGVEGLWTIVDEEGRFSATLMHFSGEEADKTRREMFDSTSEVSIPWLGNVGRHELEAGTIDVQGRVLPCLRFQALPKEEGAPAEEDEKGGIVSEFKKGVRTATIQLDLTAEGSTDFVVLQLQKLGTLERISDEEVRGFLKPFGVGPNR